MKSNLHLILIASALVSACGTVEKKNEATTPKSLQVVVEVSDITKSTDTYAILTETHVEKTYYGMGQNGGGKFYGLHIMTNSLKQDPITGDIPVLEQLPIKGNAYQQANRTRKNKQLAAEFETHKDAFITSVANKLIVPKSHDFSDLKNALELARKILENPMYRNYVKKLLIISDMENDLPPNQGIDPMEPVHFASDVKVFLVRPSDRVKLAELIPGSDYSVYTTIDDAINGMFHK